MRVLNHYGQSVIYYFNCLDDLNSTNTETRHDETPSKYQTVISCD